MINLGSVRLAGRRDISTAHRVPEERNAKKFHGNAGTLRQFFSESSRHTKRPPSFANDPRIQGRSATYKRKSCSQHGLAPFTVTVVDLTFSSFSVT